MKIGRVAEKISERLGYRVTAIWREGDLALERHLREVFAVHCIDTVLDIGANAGQYRNFLRERVGFAGTIHSFEPQPRLVEALRQAALSDPLWHVHQMGLGAENGELKLNVMERDTFSSFRQPDNRLAPQFEGSNKVVAEVLVPIRRLDDLELPNLGAVYMKSDTQGFDLEVFRGAAHVLSQARALQFELPLVNIYAGAPKYGEMLREMEALGFAVSGFFPISADASLRMIEMDCVMVAAAPSAAGGA